MDFVRDLVAGIVIIVGAVLVIISRIPKQTIDEQKKLIEALTGRIEQLEQQREEDQKANLVNVKAVAELQGQIKVYKEIPLTEIASAMKEMNTANRQIATSNALILQTLQKSALIAAEDKDLLTPSPTVIGEQTVAHQTVISKD